MSRRRWSGPPRKPCAAATRCRPANPRWWACTRTGGRDEHGSGEGRCKAVEGGAGRRGCRNGGAAVRLAQPAPPSTALDRPPAPGHPCRIREVCKRAGHHHGVSGLSRARGAGSGRGSDPRDLRHVGFHPPDHRAARQGWLLRDDARLAVAPGRDVDAAIRTYHKSYRYTVYPGVGHGFLRTRERPEVADSAWRDVIRFFKESLER